MRGNIIENIKEIVSRVFNIDINKINDELSRDNTVEWDSFNHLLLINEIEKGMGVKFTVSEVEKINTFKELKEIISSKRL